MPCLLGHLRRVPDHAVARSKYQNNVCTKITFNNSIDIVVSISTFEHTEFFWETFLEILRVLKPNGLFFLNAPSFADQEIHLQHKHPETLVLKILLQMDNQD